MHTILLTGAGVAAFALLPTAAADARIVVGKSIAGIELGMSEKEAIAAKGSAPTSARTIPDEIRGAVRELRWPGLRVIAGQQGGVSLVATTSKRETTASGVGVGTSERTLRRKVAVRCATVGSFRRCTRGRLVPGATVTDFSIGPRSRTVRSVSIGYVID